MNEVIYKPEEDELADKIWEVYERTGSMRQTARDLCQEDGYASYSRVRRVLTSDPIKLSDIRMARAESTVTRWEGKEIECAELTGHMIESVRKILSHIEECETEGKDTLLIDCRSKDRSCMSPMQARQWLMETKQLDQVSRAGVNAAKSIEGLRQMMFQGMVGADLKKAAGDPGSITDAELMMLVTHLEEAGEKIPDHVQEWYETKRRLLPAPSR